MFQSPSGNIGCVYTPEGFDGVYRTAGGRAELSCDLLEPAYTRLLRDGTSPLASNSSPRPAYSVGFAARRVNWINFQ